MRFLATALSAMALFAAVDAKRYQLDITGDNTFQVYVSKAGTAASTILLGDVDQTYADGRGLAIQEGWNTPARYTGLDLEEGDVLSVYVQNINAPVVVPGSNTPRGGNPSAIVARLRQISGGSGTFVAGGDDIPTDSNWLCAYRVENTAGPGNANLNFNPSRLTGNPDDWAAANLNPATVWNNLVAQSQEGSTQFASAVEVSPLIGANNIWDTTGINGPFGTTAILPGLNANALGDSTPYWIYGTDQHAGGPLAHHGWCRYRVPAPGNAPTSPPGAGGDPVFNGFQGQEFQFHGLPDEHFNLISSPQVQLNAHFVYLSSGKCDYNDTVCWTHPGTYMDVMGMSVGEARIKVVAGTHEAGLRLWVNDNEVPRHTTIHSLSGNVTGSLTHTREGHVIVHTDLINYEIINSDMFMNLRASIKSRELLTTGAKKHTVTDKAICHSNSETHNHQEVEQVVSKKYPINTPLHGLIGQTWRNVKVCGRDWMGTVQDYVVPTLFGTEYHYNYFQF